MFRDLESYASEHDVPIMPRESIAFITTILNETQSRSLLEVGTAIAYSTLQFAHHCQELKITTLERDEARYKIALENIARFECGQRIEARLCDALAYQNRTSYDAVLIDAAKAQNEALFKLYFAFTDKVMIIDNIDFHGFTGHASDLKSRNLRQMVKRIESFLKYLEKRSDLVVEKHDIGDGLLVIKRKSSGSFF